MTTPQPRDRPHFLPEGHTSLTPFLCVDGAAAAIDFYTGVLGASVASRNDAPDGTVAHCELQFPSGRLQLSDPAPDHGLAPPSGGPGTSPGAGTGTSTVSHSTVLYLADVDAAYAAAVAAGATGHGAPQTFVTGDRFATILDPWGHRWALMTRVEEVSPDEARRRVDEWVATHT